MENSAPVDERRMRFTLRGALLLMMLAALALGWYASHRDAQAEVRRLSLRLAMLKMQQSFSEDRAETYQDAKEHSRGSKDAVLHGVDLKGSKLRGIIIPAGQENAFQLTNFSECDLEGSTLTAGGSAFQGAQFDNAGLARATLTGGSGAFQLASFAGAELREAKLTGGSGAFQVASFAGADLSGAVLIGGDGSFQGAVFAGANLSGARLVGGDASYGGMDVDGAQFAGADLSALDADDLGTCHFEAPPTYDDKTKFPNGFDAKLAGWKRVP